MVEPLTIPEKCTKHEYCTALHEFSYFVHCLDPPPLSDCKEKEAAHIKTQTCTRDLWKVLSMVFYLSKRLRNPIMFGTILKSYLSSMLWHKFHEDIMMQARKILL